MMLSGASSQLDLQCLEALLVGFERKADIKMLLQIGNDDVLLLGQIAPSQHYGYLRMPVSS